MQVRTQLFAIFIISFGLLPLGIAGCGSSDPPNAGMVYTFAGAASGSLGALTFTDAAFTLVVAADTRALTSSTGIAQDLSEDELRRGWQKFWEAADSETSGEGTNTI